MSSAIGNEVMKVVMIVMESTSGSGHRITAFRPKVVTSRKETLAFDPLVRQTVLYRELQKIRSLKKK